MTFERVDDVDPHVGHPGEEVASEQFVLSQPGENTSEGGWVMVLRGFLSEGRNLGCGVRIGLDKRGAFLAHFQAECLGRLD